MMHKKYFEGTFSSFYISFQLTLYIFLSHRFLIGVVIIFNQLTQKPILFNS